MTRRVNGTPDRFVNEIDTWSSGGSGGVGGLVDQGNAGIQEWVIVDAAANTKLTNILTELGNILAELQGTLSVSVGNFPASVEVSNDVGNAIPVNGTVGVNNFPAFPADYPDALAESRLLTLVDKTPDEEGTWDYYAGTSDAALVVVGRVIGITAATTTAGATVTINGGDPIPLPWITGVVTSVDIAPRANLVSPTISFSGTASFLVEVVV